MAIAMAAPKARIKTRRRAMPRIDSVRSAFNETRRWAARAMFGLASRILRGSIGLYERHRIPPIVLSAHVGIGRIGERSARTALFGHRSVRNRRQPSGSH